MNAPRIIRDEQGRTLVERFSPARRAEHWLAIVSFVTLVVTGFPQKLRGTSSAWLLDTLGGLEAARFVHRVAGLVFCGHMAVHLAVFFVGLMIGRMRPSLLPGPQDLRDAWDNLGYYLGFREKPAELPKFDYRQKFEYAGLILGGFVMIFSGLALMFPVAVEALLPGSLIPAARVAHSNEAMLALLVLAVWHIYGSVLSPEVFPIDTCIFTGYLTAEELHERHAREFRRIFPDGVDGIGVGGHGAATTAPHAPPAAAPTPVLEPGKVV